MVQTLEYPVELGIAYLFLAGYILRTLFVSVSLPASVGVILSGFCFSYFCQEDILLGRDVLQELAFFLVLLTAGLEIRAKDLKPYIFVMAWLPATFELLAIATYAVLVREFTVIESLVLGVVLVCIGDGLVIPKMKEFGQRYKGHPMPRLVFTWAPLEASYGLTLFGILVGLSAPANQPSVNVGLLVLANIVRIVATLGAGALLGGGSGWLITHRTKVMFRGQQVFTGAPVESFLMILAVTLVAFGLGATEEGQAVVPIRFSTGSLFQPELLVIVTGTFFASAAEHKVLHDVEEVMGGVWVFGQLVLFSMLGSRTSPSIFPQLPSVIPLMAVGVVFRFIGVFVATFITMKTTPVDCPFNRSTMVLDACFCFLSTLPRATIQGAVGSVPVTMRFFQHSEKKHSAQDTISLAARLYIVFMSVGGMILLNIVGVRLLEASAAKRAQLEQEELERVDPHEHGQPDVPEADALQAVADMFSLTADQVQEVLRKAGDVGMGSDSTEGFQPPLPQEEWEVVNDQKPETNSPREGSLPLKFFRAHSDPTGQGQICQSRRGSDSWLYLPVAEKAELEAVERYAPNMRRTVRQKQRLKTGLALAQFDMAGSQVAYATPKRGKMRHARSRNLVMPEP